MIIKAGVFPKPLAAPATFAVTPVSGADLPTVAARASEVGVADCGNYRAVLGAESNLSLIYQIRGAA